MTENAEKAEVLDPPKATIVPGFKRKPKGDLARAKILIYGPPKIGKTTLASQFPGVWFMATEEGQDWLEVFTPTVIESWDHFLDVCKYIAEEQPTHFGDGTKIETIAIDTGGLLFKTVS